MNERTALLIFGGSARGAAFSALRAGFDPWCADFFADADLAARCPLQQVKGRDYPYGFLRVIEQAPQAAWMYTGALENRPCLVKMLSRKRPLWGCGVRSLGLARRPQLWSQALRDAGLPCPAFCLEPAKAAKDRSWLAKPLKSAGGFRVHAWQAGGLERGYFLQERIEGEPASSVYVGDGRRALLLGSSRQLIGRGWLHTSSFKYCGSIGPLELEPAVVAILETMGNVLAERCELKGLFGIDFILRDGVPWPIEINPRYTASIEVLEHALGDTFLSYHRQVFETPGTPLEATMPRSRPAGFVGKAILFARADLVIPEEGPWLETLHTVGPVDRLPAYADIPAAGTTVASGYPVMTCFATGATPAEVEARLRQKAAELDELLNGASVI